MTVVALDLEAAFEIGRMGINICLAKGDSMPVENILAEMKPKVFALYHPTVIGIFPHTNLLGAITMYEPA